MQYIYNRIYCNIKIPKYEDKKINKDLFNIVIIYKIEYYFW